MPLRVSHGICNSELEEIRGHSLVLVPYDGFWLIGYCDITPSAPLLLGPLQERSDFSRNFIRVRFQREMPGISGGRCDSESAPLRPVSPAAGLLDARRRCSDGAGHDSILRRQLERLCAELCKVPLPGAYRR